MQAGIKKMPGGAPSKWKEACLKHKQSPQRKATPSPPPFRLHLPFQIPHTIQCFDKHEHIFSDLKVWKKLEFLFFILHCSVSDRCFSKSFGWLDLGPLFMELFFLNIFYLDTGNKKNWLVANRHPNIITHSLQLPHPKPYVHCLSVFIPHCLEHPLTYPIVHQFSLQLTNTNVNRKSHPQRHSIKHTHTIPFFALATFLISLPLLFAMQSLWKAPLGQWGLYSFIACVTCPNYICCFYLSCGYGPHCRHFFQLTRNKLIVKEYWYVFFILVLDNEIN